MYRKVFLVSESFISLYVYIKREICACGNRARVDL